MELITFNQTKKNLFFLIERFFDAYVNKKKR